MGEATRAADTLDPTDGSASIGGARGPTLRRRLERTLGVRLLLAWAVTTLAVSATVRHDLNELHDSSLLAVAGAIEAVAAAESTPAPSGWAWLAMAMPPAVEPLVEYRLRERNGNASEIRGRAVRDAIHAELIRRADEQAVELVLAPRAAGEPARIVGEPARIVEVSQGLAERRLAILDILLAMLLPALLILPVGVLSLRATLARELAPLDALATEIDRRDGNDLSRVHAPGVPGELDSLVRGLDRLLQRLRRALDAERDFAGTTAHELRTPLAGALAQTQRLLAETHGAAHERARRVERSLHALQHLTGRLLELARAEGAGTVVERAVDLAPVLERTVAVVACERDAGANLVLDDTGGELRAHLDPDAFSMLVRNLVENALVHGDPDEPVIVSRRGRRIDVENAGPVLGADERVRLRQRFARGPRGGAGLGLAIVYAVVEGGGVDVELESPRPGRPDGVRARVTLAGR